MRLNVYDIEKEQSLRIKEEMTNDIEACLLTWALRGDLKRWQEKTKLSLRQSKAEGVWAAKSWSTLVCYQALQLIRH